MKWKNPQKHKLPKLIQEEIVNLNKLISKETETVTINFPLKKIPGPEGYISEFYQPLKELPLILSSKLFQKWKIKQHFQTHEATVIPMSKM